MGRRPGSKNLTPQQRSALPRRDPVSRPFVTDPENLKLMAELDLDPDQWRQSWTLVRGVWQIGGWRCLQCDNTFVRLQWIKDHPAKCRGRRSQEEPEEWLEMRLRDGTIRRRNQDED